MTNNNTGLHHITIMPTTFFTLVYKFIAVETVKVRKHYF